jgi:hypothetical protein
MHLPVILPLVTHSKNETAEYMKLHFVGLFIFAFVVPWSFRKSKRIYAPLCVSSCVCHSK